MSVTAQDLYSIPCSSVPSAYKTVEADNTFKLVQKGQKVIDLGALIRYFFVCFLHNS
jgi:hypothetical protein